MLYTFVLACGTRGEAKLAPALIVVDRAYGHAFGQAGAQFGDLSVIRCKHQDIGKRKWLCYAVAVSKCGSGLEHGCD